MINSMTGFASREKDVPHLGKVSVEIRSSNHKFLEIVTHLPEGFLSLEDNIKKEIESQVKRGRITCVVSLVRTPKSNISINRQLVKEYIHTLREIKEQFHLEDGINLGVLINLPGVLSLGEAGIDKKDIWPHLSALIKQAVLELARARQKEGRALFSFLRKRAFNLKRHIKQIKMRFKKVSQIKAGRINNDEERISFLKDTDITEEIERLTFHISNFIRKMNKNSPVGKELDFIAQEMQREANTIGAKSFDALISGRVIEIKSQIEKMREQLQNIE